MTNELRKTIGPNMRYVDMNEQIDNQIKELEKRAFYDFNVQAQISALKQQKAANEQLMVQPMTEQEYAEYDDNGQYIGNTIQQTPALQQNNSIGQMAMDGVNHLAQGSSLGWSDELNGIYGGAGRVIANGLMRAAGQNVNGESFSDAWNKGYTEYRDFARQELDDGYQRNPVISAGSEIIGSAMAPIKIHTPRGYTGSLGGIVSHSSDIAKSRMINTIGTGVINGAGYTNDNTLGNYAQNIGMSTITNIGGTALGNRLFGSGNNMYKFGRGTMNGIIQTLPYAINYLENKNEK
jgi:hypothetical protein